MISSRKPLQAALGLGALALLSLASTAAQAQTTVTFTGTGTEAIEQQRLFRNAVPSTFDMPKTFPGTINEADRYQLFTFANPTGMNAIFDVNVTSPDFGTFYSVYDTFFNPTNLAQNYLGDGGVSGPTNFSILATPGEDLILVANTVRGINTATTSTFTATFAPVPEASTTVSFGLLLALGGAGVVVAAKRKKAAASAA
jgi:hypothetical protein